MLEDFINWVQENPVELSGTILSFIYLYFSVQRKVLMWFFGIVSSALYVHVYFSENLYADMSLYVYYLIVSLYGWYFWLYGNDSSSSEPVKITTVGKNLFFKLTGAFFIIYGILLFALLFLPDKIGLSPSSLPYLDAFTSAASVVATWMLARKMLEQWLLWIFVDIVSLGMYLSKGMNITAFLFLVYALVAVWGYMEWEKEYKNYSA